MKKWWEIIHEIHSFILFVFKQSIQVKNNYTMAYRSSNIINKQALKME